MGKRSKHIDYESSEEYQVEQNLQEEEKNRRQKKILNHNFKLKHIKPLTENQEKAFRGYWEGQNLLLHGVAGTGKSYIALYLALNDVLKGTYKKLIIVRNTVTSKEVGFLPGSLEEKLAVFELPYRDMINDLLQRGDAYDLLKKKEYLEFTSTAFLRGLTWDDVIVFVDEGQNQTLHEISSTLTRMGKNSKIIIAGDLFQNDLVNTGKKHEKTGFDSMIKIANHMRSFDTIQFELGDICRSGFVKEFLIAKINLTID